MDEQGDHLHLAQQRVEKLRQLLLQCRKLPGPPPLIRQVVTVITRAAQALGGQARAVLQHWLTLPADAASLFFRLGGDANTGERLGVAGDKPVQAGDQGQRVAPVGLHLLAILVPVARAHDDALEAELQQPSVQPETKRTGFVATMHDVGRLHLLGRPRHEALGREPLGRLRRGAVDLARDHILAQMHIDAELDQPVWFYALRGRCDRSGLDIVSCHLGGQVAASAPA